MPGLHSFPTRRSSDLLPLVHLPAWPVAPPPSPGAPFTSITHWNWGEDPEIDVKGAPGDGGGATRSEEHTSELQSLRHLVCRLLLEKKKTESTRNQKTH